MSANIGTTTGVPIDSARKAINDLYSVIGQLALTTEENRKLIEQLVNRPQLPMRVEWQQPSAFRLILEEITDVPILLTAIFWVAFLGLGILIGVAIS